MVHQIPVHPYIRLVDNSPSRGSQLHLGKVQRGDIVSIVLEATFNASSRASITSRRNCKR